MTRTRPIDPRAAGAFGASASPAVRLERVSKSYREGDAVREVLRELTLELARGEFVAITGRSGSGKSTLLNLIAGIDLPDAGDVWVDGEHVGRLGEAGRARVRREHIGFVYQSYNLIPTLTVRENLLLALELRGRLAADATRRADEMLAAVGLAGRGASFPDRLSGGEQQRAAIARALVHDPALVLADEPTGNLDDRTAQQVIELFERLLRPRSKTLILVTHSREVARIADRTWRLAEGRMQPENA